NYPLTGGGSNPSRLNTAAAHYAPVLITPCQSKFVAPASRKNSAAFDAQSSRRFVCCPATNPHRCSVAFSVGSGTRLSSAFFTNSTESIAAPVERETCESPHSSVLAGPPTSQQRDSLLLRRLPSFDRWRRRGRSSPWSCLSL